MTFSIQLLVHVLGWFCFLFVFVFVTPSAHRGSSEARDPIQDAAAACTTGSLTHCAGPGTEPTARQQPQLKSGP